jgi:hypothetical protein
MLKTFTREQLGAAGPRDVSDELERGRIVSFPECPVELPSAEDLDFLRRETPDLITAKNLSYHPEDDHVGGIRGSPEQAARVGRILKTHTLRVQELLRRIIPDLAREWTVGTSSFRPLQEKGRNLSAHASNELVHVDAGAYGATHGDRVLRFFVNVNPSEDRVWVTKGAFPELYERHGREAGVRTGSRKTLDEGLLDRLWTGTTRAVSSVFPTAKHLDSSPYDRAMRRFHNYMKDTPAFQSCADGHAEFRFKPMTAWMVFTDMVSHACIEGQHALVDTFVVPLRSCRLQDLAPLNILKGP